MLLCSSRCQKKADKVQGNLNNHSTELHGGVCAFLNVESGSVYLINSPKNIEYQPLYCDKYGYPVDQKKKDWSEYKLDKALLNDLKEKFIYGKIPQDIFY